jgi:hypothetical protein
MYSCESVRLCGAGAHISIKSGDRRHARCRRRSEARCRENIPPDLEDPMARIALTIGLFTLVLNCSVAVAEAADGPVFDDSGYHPSILPPGSLEYEYALQRQKPSPPETEDQAQLSEALAACRRIAPLSTATREKCEIKARQTAAHPAPAKDTRLN